MAHPQPQTTAPKTEKPARHKGPVGLLLYGALTILGGLALVLIIE